MIDGEALFDDPKPARCFVERKQRLLQQHVCENCMKCSEYSAVASNLVCAGLISRMLQTR